MKKYFKLLLLLFVSLIVLFVYLNTTPPVFKNNDSPAITSITYTLGLAHPPGYPLYILTSKFFTYLTLGNPGFRTNIVAIILSIFVLIITFYILENLTFILLKKKYTYFNIFILLVLSFSYIYWNQSIEAKGGIYILNLLFLSLIILLILKLKLKFDIKYFRLIIFLYSLSLSNHWPSMILLFLIILHYMYKYKNKFKANDYFIFLTFFILGLTPYLYLLIRGNNEIIWALSIRPKNFKELIDVIIRKDYIHNAQNIKRNLYLYKYQLKEFFKLFFSNFSILWIFIFIGGYNIYKKNKKIFYILTYVFLYIIFLVVFYNKTNSGTLWLIDIFLLPAEYIFFIFIAWGIYFFVEKTHKDKIKLSVLFCLTIIFGFYLFFINFKFNNNRNNFLAYDYGDNILKSIDNDAIYLAEVDYNIFPVMYLLTFKGNNKNIKLIPITFLQFNWYHTDLLNEYIKTETIYDKIIYIIKNNINKHPVYRSTFSPFFILNKINYFQRQEGIIKRILLSDKIKDNKYIWIFKTFSYRGIYSFLAKNLKLNRDLIAWYPEAMIYKANELLLNKDYISCINLCKFTENFPYIVDKYRIYYILAFIYNKIGDEKNEIKYLEKTLKLNPELKNLYNRLMFLYKKEKNNYKREEK